MKQKIFLFFLIILMSFSVYAIVDVKYGGDAAQNGIIQNFNQLSTSVNANSMIYSSDKYPMEGNRNVIYTKKSSDLTDNKNIKSNQMPEIQESKGYIVEFEEKPLAVVYEIGRASCRERV